MGTSGVPLGVHSGIVGLNPSSYTSMYQRLNYANKKGKNYSRSLFSPSTNERRSFVSSDESMTCLSVMTELHLQMSSGSGGHVQES